MYSFTDTNAPPFSRGPLVTTWRGVTLDSLLEGRFRTLDVTGRELLAPDLQTTPVVGGPGEWVTVSELPARPLVVTAWVHRSATSQLMSYLGTGEGELRWSDEPYTWNAVMRDIEQPPEEIYYNSGSIVRLYFLATDPYKYGLKVTSDLIPRHYPLPVRPDKIVLRVKRQTVTPRIYTEKRTMAITGTYSEGEVITIDYQALTLKRGLESIMNRLDIRSDFLDYYIDPGDRIRSQAGDVTMTFRERRL